MKMPSVSVLSPTDSTDVAKIGKHEQKVCHSDLSILVQIHPTIQRATKFREQSQNVRHPDQPVAVNFSRALAGLTTSVVIQCRGVEIASLNIHAPHNACSLNVCIQPIQSLQHPIPEELHFLFISVAYEHIGPNVFAKPRPSRVVADAWLSQYGVK